MHILQVDEAKATQKRHMQISSVVGFELVFSVATYLNFSHNSLLNKVKVCPFTTGNV